ncbi:MAG TPA: cytochrome c [Terriglobia bacterium]|nr:cytochrome c [Terriglobia bacterium]
MRKSRTPIFGLALSLGFVLSASSAEKPTRKSIELPADNAMATLKAGAGMEVTRGNCSICHSTDYIVRQAGGDAAHWRPEVEKMIKVYGAPVSDEDARTIVEYLASAYDGRAADSARAETKRQR